MMAAAQRHLSCFTSKLLQINPAIPKIPTTLGTFLQQQQHAARHTLATQHHPPITRSLSVTRASYVEQQMESEPSIGEVDWTPEILNSVNLVGNLGKDLELRYLANGSIVANVALAVRRSQDKTDWVELEVWGPLAEYAQRNVRKGTRVHVEGRLKVDEWTDANSNKRRATRVVVRSLNLLRATPMAEPQDAPAMSFGATAQAAPSSVAADASWQQLATASNFQSTPRTTAATPSRSAPPPPQQQQQAAQQYANVPVPQYDGEPRDAANPNDPAHRKWLDYFDNPNNYWDNRTNKRNPKAPDFKQKEGNEALWISSRDTPPWVIAQLEFAEDMGADEDIPF